jgi:hypothetical protein
MRQEEMSEQTPTERLTLAAAKDFMNLLLRVPCSRHDAPSNVPCYEMPKGFCGERISRAAHLRTRPPR